MRIEIKRKDITDGFWLAIGRGWSDDLEILAKIATVHPDTEFFRADGDENHITEFTAEEILRCKRQHIQIT